MDIQEITLAVTAVAAVVLGIAVYQRTPDRVWNRLFAVHASVSGIWTFLTYLLETSQSVAQASIYLRLLHPVVAMAACTVVDFAWVFPDRIDYADARRRIFLYGTGLLFGTIGFSPNLFHNIQVGPDTIHIEYGWLYVPFGAFILIALAYADFLLLRKVFRLEGMQRVQATWVMLGMATTHATGLLVLVIIPLVWGTTAYSGWGAASLIVTLAGMGYAIAKHRLMQPDMALRRFASTAAAAAIVLVLGMGALRIVEPLAAANGLPERVAYAAVGLVMGVLIVLVHGKISGLVRRALSSSTDPAAVQAETSSRILRTLDSEQLLELLARALDDALEPTRIVVYTLSRSGDELVPRVTISGSELDKSNGEPSLSLRHSVLEVVADEGGMITRDQVFRFASLSEARRLSLALDELDAHAVAPMIWEDELIGAVILGPKCSGEMYTGDELRFVADLVLQASLALRNADLYAETAALKDFNERILSQMDNAVVVTDDRERIVVFNEAAQRLFALSAERAIGSSIDILPKGIANCIRASMGSGRILSSRQFQIERGDQVLPLACSTSPLEGERDVQNQGAVAVISDLTLIQELDQEREEAERLALIRVISAGMAHEIRNPLVAIRTFAELAPRRLDDPEFRSNFLTVVQEEIKRIDKLVADLMTLSKPADAVVEELDVELICEGVLRATAGMAEARHIELAGDLGEISGIPTGDETRLHQALLNIVSNAIDAEPDGGTVTLQAKQVETEDGEMVRIRVHNPGSYIPPEQTDEIFRPFVSKKPKGTGLGLAICQTIIEEHDGEILLKSTPETGTTFIVEPPLSGAPAPAPGGGRGS